jgi:hypothetical protein
MATLLVTRKKKREKERKREKEKQRDNATSFDAPSWTLSTHKTILESKWSSS